MKVLIVEDSFAVRRFIAFALSVFKQLSLDEAGDGVAALKKLKAETYDLVLLDINLPLLDGMKLLAMMRRDPGPMAETPVVVITSEGDLDTARQATQLGATRILHKPAPAYTIRDAVERCLGREHPPSTPEEERRRSPRLPIEVSVHLAGESPQTLQTWDISPYGAFLISDQPPPTGTVAEASIELPHLDDPIRVQCTVAHVRERAQGGLPAGFGVSFAHDAAEVSERLLTAFLLDGPT
jgi:two-component system chemotaxis response regulator CheY